MTELLTPGGRRDVVNANEGDAEIPVTPSVRRDGNDVEAKVGSRAISPRRRRRRRGGRGTEAQKQVNRLKDLFFLFFFSVAAPARLPSCPSTTSSPPFQRNTFEIARVVCTVKALFSSPCITRAVGAVYRCTIAAGNNSNVDDVCCCVRKSRLEQCGLCVHIVLFNLKNV